MGVGAGGSGGQGLNSDSGSSKGNGASYSCAEAVVPLEMSDIWDSET